MPKAQKARSAPPTWSALYTVWYNFARIKSAVRMAPAMAAGISERLWDMVDIVKLIDDAVLNPGQRGPYKKRGANA